MTKTEYEGILRVLQNREETIQERINNEVQNLAESVTGGVVNNRLIGLVKSHTEIRNLIAAFDELRLNLALED